MIKEQLKTNDQTQSDLLKEIPNNSKAILTMKREMDDVSNDRQTMLELKHY